MGRVRLETESWPGHINGWSRYDLPFFVSAAVLLQLIFCIVLSTVNCHIAILVLQYSYKLQLLLQI